MSEARNSLAFRLGYWHGLQTGEPASQLEVEKQYPFLSDEEVRIYLNGREDGIKNDPWRARQVPDGIKRLSTSQIVYILKGRELNEQTF